MKVNSYNTGSPDIAVAASGYTSDIIAIKEGFSIYAKYTNNTPSPKTFNTGVASSKVIQDLTYTAKAVGTAGDSITVAYLAGGTAGAESVSVTGTAISVTIESGVSTADQVKAAVDAKTEAAALVSVAVSGTGGTAQVAAVAANLTGGVDENVFPTTDTITMAAHGYATGLKVRLTTTGTLPAGVSLATDYWVIKVDANTIKLADSLAHSAAGTAVNITDTGTGVHTVTATALAGASIKLQYSNDNKNWEDVDNSSVSITTTGSHLWSDATAKYAFVKIVMVMTAGQLGLYWAVNCPSKYNFVSI